MKFIPTATLGIMAREYEQQQLIGLLQTLGPNTPVLPIILKGIIANSSLSNRAEMEAALEQMSQPNPEQQQQQQMAAQMAMEQSQAQTASLQAKAQRDQAEAQKAMVEAQLAPEESKAKIISSLTTNLDENNESKDFQNRVKLAELMLKEKEIDQNMKVVELQTMAKKKKDEADNNFKAQFTSN
jgi:hypothetical protein